jgi:putative CocE/NonD family hydrolase
VRPYGEDKYPAKLGPSEHFIKANYIFVNQDVRGRFASEGEFVHVTPHLKNKTKPTDVDESSDTFDTIEWLLKNVPNHNGRVGMYGISYPGFYAAAGMIDAHPALKAVSPQAPIGDWYFDDFLHHLQIKSKIPSLRSLNPASTSPFDKFFFFETIFEVKNLPVFTQEYRYRHLLYKPLFKFEFIYKTVYCFTILARFPN